MVRRSIWFACCLLVACTATDNAPPATAPEQQPAQAELLPGCAPGEDRPEALRFGFTPYLGRMTQRQFEPIVEWLSGRLDYPVRLVYAETYEALQQMILNGEVDIASLSPLSFIKAQQAAPCIQPLLTQVAFGSPYYAGYLLVQSDSPYSTVDDLKGKRLAFASPNSASGYLFPYAYLLERGIDPEHFFSKIVFAGNHMAAMQMLLDGRVDVTATLSSFIRPARLATLDVGGMRVLAITGRIPYDAICARPGLAPDLTRRVVEALRELDSATPAGRRVLGRIIKLNGWVPTTEAIYDPVRRTLDRVARETAR